MGKNESSLEKGWVWGVCESLGEDVKNAVGNTGSVDSHLGNWLQEMSRGESLDMEPQETPAFQEWSEGEAAHKN